MNIIEKAIMFAVNAHSGAKRKSTSIPYILHPLEAAAIASELTDDEEVIAAAVLHDVIEDTDYGEAELRSDFGDRIVSLICSDTEDKRRDRPAEETWRVRKQETIDHLAGATEEELIIAFSDKLANLRAIWNDYLTIWESFWERFSQKDPKEQLWYYESVYKVCDRLADKPVYREYGWRLHEIRMRIREYEETGGHDTNALEVLATPDDRKWVFRMAGSEVVLSMTDNEFQEFLSEQMHGRTDT